MSRKSDPFTDFFNSLKGKSSANDEELTLENLCQNDNVQNLLGNDTALNFLLDFAPQMTSHFITPQTVQKMLDANPKLTDELISEQIDLFLKDHPESNELMNKYLQPYCENHSNKSIYQIRKFVRSDDCKKALEDPEVKHYLKQLLASPGFKDKIKQLKKK